MLPKFSIIVCTYNGEKKIEDLLDSLLKLDYPTDLVDVIIVDGGSTDNTVNMVRKYPFRLITYDSRKSIGVTKNAGVKEAKAQDLILFTDDDCILDRNILKEYARAYDKYKFDFAGGSLTPYSLSNYFEKYVAFAKAPMIAPVSMQKEQHRYRDYLLTFIGLKQYKDPEDGEQLFSALGSNSCYKNEVIKSIKFDENLFPGDDWEANIQLNKKGYKGIYVRSVKVYHKHRSNFKSFLKHVFSYGAMRYKLYKKHPKEATFLPFPMELTLLLSLPLLSIEPLIPTGIFLFLIIKEMPFALKMCFDKKDVGILFSFPILEFLRYFIYNIGMFYGVFKYYKAK